MVIDPENALVFVDPPGSKVLLSTLIESELPCPFVWVKLIDRCKIGEPSSLSVEHALNPWYRNAP